MATFRIHEDVENSIPNKVNLVPSKLNNDKRSTFADLNNVQRAPKTHALKTVIFISNFPTPIFAHNLQMSKINFWFYCFFLKATDLQVTKTKVFNDENAAPKDAFVPVDKFKSFNVAIGSSKNVSASSDESAKMDTIQNTSTFR